MHVLNATRIQAVGRLVGIDWTLVTVKHPTRCPTLCRHRGHCGGHGQSLCPPRAPGLPNEPSSKPPSLPMAQRPPWSPASRPVTSVHLWGHRQHRPAAAHLPSLLWLRQGPGPSQLPPHILLFLLPLSLSIGWPSNTRLSCHLLQDALPQDSQTKCSVLSMCTSLCNLEGSRDRSACLHGVEGPPRSALCPRLPNQGQALRAWVLNRKRRKEGGTTCIPGWRGGSTAQGRGSRPHGGPGPPPRVGGCSEKNS